MAHQIITYGWFLYIFDLHNLSLFSAFLDRRTLDEPILLSGGSRTTKVVVYVFAISIPYKIITN